MIAAPTKDRIESLDVLRGAAVLGIFAVNIQAMALPLAMFANPSLNPEFLREGGAFWWAVAATFFQFKFITIFSALFGAGVMMMAGEEKPSPRFGLHMRRMFWLLIFGLAHAFFIWYGDILTAYAIAGVIIVAARRWGPRALFIGGLILIAAAFALFMGQHFAMEAASPEDRAAMIDDFWAPPQEVVAAEIEAYRGGFLERLPETAPNAGLFLMVQSLGLAPRTIGLMMIGMALYKTGFFTLRRSMFAYLTLGLMSLAIGLLGSVYGTTQFIDAEFDMMALAPGQAAQYWASLPHAFGYAALVLAACKPRALTALRAPLAAAGKMALTNYLVCSLIGAFLYYGPPGLGRIGTASYGELALTVGLVWIGMLIISPLWLSIFRFGPFEWLWRSLTYARLQPLLRARPG